MSAARPRVSVVIASHNYAQFLGEAIESVLAQRGEAAEIIVVDDGSTDDSPSVARRHPVRLIEQPNAGVGAARNRGAAEARGEYLLFLDADDRLAPDYLEQCVAALDRAPARVAFAYTPMELFGAETGRFDPPEFDARRLLLGNTVHASALMRRQAFEAVGGFDERWRLAHEDHELWIRMLSRGLRGLKVPGTALHYRRHAASRNTIDPEQLELVERALWRAHPRLYWRQIARSPLSFVAHWASDALGGRSVRAARPPRPGAAPAVTLSVVVVNWNSRDDLAACLRSLEAQTDTDFELLVVDNGSEDGSVELVRAEFPRVILLPTGENLGFAEGCNRGIAAATGSWIATLNNDAEADPRWIAELRRAAQEGDARLGMLQSRIVFRQRPDRTNSTGVLLFPDATANDRAFDAPVVEEEPEDEIFCPSAGAAAYARRMLDDVRLPTGFFDRTFFMYFEDVDLGWRGRLSGWTARYVPSAVVRHAFHGSASRKGRHFVEAQCKQNRLRMLLKNGSPGFVARGVPRTVLDLVWTVKTAGPASLREYVRALRDGARQRALVAGRARVARGDVERRWVSRPAD